MLTSLTFRLFGNQFAPIFFAPPPPPAPLPLVALFCMFRFCCAHDAKQPNARRGCGISNFNCFDASAEVSDCEVLQAIVKEELRVDVKWRQGELASAGVSPTCLRSTVDALDCLHAAASLHKPRVLFL